MPTADRKTLFALDPGATNWRLFRAVYQQEGGRVRLLSEPASSPLTSFTERRLPAVLLLNPAGDAADCYGEAAELLLEQDDLRPRLRAYFKPSIGSQLMPEPRPQQTRYTHQEALAYTRLLLAAVLDGIRREKWRGAPFDDTVVFSFAHPVHWAEEYQGAILDDFRTTVRSCFPEENGVELRFVSEPEAAVHSLQRRSLLGEDVGLASLILDIGGSTMDLVSSDLASGAPTFLSRYGSPLGGDLFDAALAGSIAEELNLPEGLIAEDPAIGITLRTISKRLKEALSRQLLQEEHLRVIPQRAVTLVSRGGTVYRGTVRMDQARFDELTRDLQRLFETLFDQALHAMSLKDDAIGRVILVGGGSQLYSVVRFLRNRFGPERVMIADNPAETVVHGVSLEYGAELAKARPTMLFMTGLVPLAELPAEALKKEPAWQLSAAEGESFPLKWGVNTIGRSPANDVRIRSEKMSREHALLTIAEELILKDLGSTNGTFVDDVRIAVGRGVVIEAGAKLRFGDRSFTLEQV